MKHILFAAIALLMTTIAAFAHETDTDTVLSVQNANNIVITESPDGLLVTVKGNDTDENFVSTFEEKYSKNVKIKSRQWYERSPIKFGSDESSAGKDDIVMSGLCFGMVEALGAPSGAGFELGKSFEISLVEMLAYRRRISNRSYISIGFGMDWRTYRNSKGTTQFVLDENGKVVCGSFPDGVKPEGSQIKIVRVGFPIMWRQDVGRRSSVKFGVILNMTSHASLKSRWINEQGNEVDQYNGNINTRFFTVDLMATYMVTSWIGFYGRWTPQSVLRTSGNNSPKFSTLSFGLVTLF